jgi:hypothetical protein
MDSQSTLGDSALRVALTTSDSCKAATEAKDTNEKGHPTMTATPSHDHDFQRAIATVSSVTVQLHRAELALHDAHGSHVDAWISAAANKLHESVVRYEQARIALAGFTSVAA